MSTMSRPAVTFLTFSNLQTEQPDADTSCQDSPNTSFQSGFISANSSISDYRAGDTSDTGQPPVTSPQLASNCEILRTFYINQICISIAVTDLIFYVSRPKCFKSEQFYLDQITRALPRPPIMISTSRLKVSLGEW